MIPWSLRWRSFVWAQIWIYKKLWRDHPLVVIMAGLGVAFLLHLGLGF